MFPCDGMDVFLKNAEITVVVPVMTADFRSYLNWSSIFLVQFASVNIAFSFSSNTR